MQEDKFIIENRFPIRFLTATIVLTILVLLWLGWSSYRSYDIAKKSNQFSGKASALQGKILHLDEVLTMSARMCAATGDLKWEERYHYFEPQLDAAIKEAIQIAPEVNSGKAAQQTDAANIALIKMEAASFDLVRQGQTAEAQKILFGEEYEQQKKIYAEGTREFTTILLNSVSKSIDSESRVAFFNVLTMFIALIVLIFGWGLVLRMVRRWEKVILEKNDLLERHSSELIKLNESLDAKVKERTQELESAKTVALDKAKHAQQAEEGMRFLKTIILEISTSDNFYKALKIVLRRVCETTELVIGEAWTPSQNGQYLEFTSCWCQQLENLSEFKDESNKLTLAPGSGLPGRVWASRNLVWIKDVTLDPNFLRTGLARKLGLKAGLGIPITAQDEVVAVLVFFLKEGREKDEKLISLISAIADQLGMVIKRKQTEEALRISEERNRTIIETANDAFVSISGESLITRWNHKAQLIFGWSSQEVMGKSLTETIIPPEYREAHKKGIERYFQTGEGPVLAKTIEITALHKEGKIFPIEITIWQTPQMRQFNAFIRDISQRKFAEEQRKKAEEDLKDNLEQLEKFLAVAVDRENFMIGLKKEVNQLCAELNRKPLYDLSFLNDDNQSFEAEKEG